MALPADPPTKPIMTKSSYQETPIYNSVVEPSLLRTFSTEDIYLLSGQYAILCQFAHPALAKGTYRHSNFAKRIPNRLDNTMRFMNAATYGTEEEKRAIFSVIHRYHSRVKGDDYDANDPELHKWTAATLFVSFVAVHNVFFGELSREQTETLFKEFAIFGTSLRMPPEMWPDTLDEFWEYWNHNIATLEITDMARTMCHQLLYPVHVPLWMRALSPVARLVTINLLPERLAKEYHLEPTALNRWQYYATISAIRVSYLSLPDSMRQTMYKQRMDDLSTAVSKIKSTGHWG